MIVLRTATDADRAPAVDWFAIAPELALFGAAIVDRAAALARAARPAGPRRVDAHSRSRASSRRASVPRSSMGLRATTTVRTRRSSGMVAVDGFAVFVRSVILGATLLALLLSAGYLARERLEGPEYLALDAAARPRA